MRLIHALAKRLPLPRRYVELAELVARFHGLVHRAAELKPSTVLKLLEKTDALRRADRFADFLCACEADARGRTGLENRPYPQGKLLRGALGAARSVTTKQLASELSGEALGEALREARLAAVKAYLDQDEEQPPP